MTVKWYKVKNGIVTEIKGQSCKLKKKWYEETRVPNGVSATLIARKLRKRGWQTKIRKTSDGWWGVYVKY